MKALITKFFIFYFLFFIFFSCSSVPKEYIVNNNICDYNNPIFKITKEDISLNINEYKKSFGKKDTTIINNKKFKNQYWSLSNGYITNKQTNKQTSISKWIGFYNDGKIESVHFRYENGSAKIGKETLYDQQGNIEKIIDYEKGYKICWAEAIEIVKQIAKKDIKKYEIKEFYVSRNDLNEFPAAKPIWTIGLMNGNEKFSSQKDKKGNIRYVIDGITGKLINTFRVRMTY